MADQAKNILIGLFVLAAAGIAIFILMFLHPSVGDESRKLRVRFSNIDKVSLGTRVNFAGKPVGEVVEIKDVEDGRKGKHDSSGRLYVYELELLVDSSIHVYNTDEVAVKTSGLLGERNIEITPIAPKKGQPLRIIDEDVIYAAETGSVEDAIKELKDVGHKFEVMLDTITDILYDVKDQKVITKLANTLGNVESITAALNKPDQWSELLDTISEVAKNAQSFTSDGRTLTARITAGEGSLGRLLVKDDFYMQTSALLAKADTTMNDINHYGLLFHMDKNWQRLRARRLNLMQQLACPQEFRNFFNDEMDLITTSLERVYMILDETSGLPCFCEILQNPEFTKVFSELMRRVNTLEEELKMYNIQLMECDFKKFEFADCNNCSPCFGCN